MAQLSFSPEWFRSLAALPEQVRREFDEAFAIMERRGPDVNLLDTHQLNGARHLSTLRIGAFRGIFRWGGDEARFIPFGPRATVYRRLPK